VDRDDLLRLLDLEGKEDPEATEGPDIRPDVPVPARAASPTALRLDGWALRRGRDLLKESERMQGMGLGAEAVADFHGCAFEPDPQLNDACVDESRHRFIEALLQTPDYHALHEDTLLDEAASCLAAVAFAEQFDSLRKEEVEQKEKKAGAVDEEMATLRAVGKALTKAEEDVTEMREAAGALGLGPGSPGSNDPAAIAALFRRVRSNPALRRICTLAGRFRRVAQSKQRQKAVHGVDDVVGVTLDGEVGRLLPSELSRLLIPELELDTLRRITERQALCRLYHAAEPVAKGPILVTIDESGSMMGPKVETAKALALALAWVARQQRRWCGLASYSGSSGERLLALPPGRWDEAALLDWLEGFIGRGSSLDVPLVELPDYYRRLGCPAGKTDVIMVTDAQVRIPAELRDSFNAWKNSVQARVIGLVIRSAAGDLAAVCDEVHLVDALSPEGEAEGRALSV
jgi:uncharacterized protein with von Willebrand factor type A (vWA) domain